MDNEQIKEPENKENEFLKNFIGSIKGDKGDIGERGEFGEKGDKGDRGEDGYTPIKGKDYHTDEEVEFLINYIIEKVKPKKGIDYIDGKDGVDGKSIDENIVIEKVLSKIEKPQDGKDAILDEESLIKKIINKLRTTDKLDISNIRNFQQLIGTTNTAKLPKLDMNDQRYHGAGMSVASIIDDETPIGVINGINTIFTLANTPIASSVKVYLNGARQHLTDDYTLSGATITFLSAPLTGSILLVDYRI